MLFDDRVPPPEWLKRDFVDTSWDIGSDEGYPDRDIGTSSGEGKSIDHVFSVWRRDVTEPTTVVDLTTDTPVVVRFGKGDTADFEA